jgi:hypothetical protein
MEDQKNAAQRLNWAARANQKDDVLSFRQTNGIKQDFSSIPVLAVAQDLLGEIDKDRSSPSEKHFHGHQGLFVNTKKNLWFSHGQDIGGKAVDLVMYAKGCGFPQARQWLQDQGYLYKPNGKATTVANYTYQDEQGGTLFVVDRLDPKGFRQRRPDGNGGWLHQIGTTRRVLYRLPELLEAVASERPVFIAEGEKAVDALRKLGVTATCSPGGAGKWRDEYAKHLRGANVIALPDNDDCGQRHAEDVVRSLTGIASSIKVLNLPNLPPKGDPYDWIEAGGTAEVLWALADKCEGVTCDGLTSVAEVEPEHVSWVWRDRLALGKLTLLGGDPDMGKSQIAIDAAARITTGRHWPNGERAETGSAIFICSEDAVADTIRPRLEAAGADIARVYIFAPIVDGRRKTFSLQDDLDRLARAIKSVGDVKLVVLDAITSYMGGKIDRGGKIDSNSTTDVRGVLEPVGDFANEHGVAILAITHPPKAAQAKAMHAFTGSLAFVAAARLAFYVTREPETVRRLLLAVKNNLGPKARGIGYTIGTKTVTNGIIAPHILWDDAPVDFTADQAIAANAQALKDGGALQDAKEFLREALATGPVAAKDIEEAAEQALISQRTLWRARKELGIVAKRKGGLGGQGSWQLSLKAAKGGH